MAGVQDPGLAEHLLPAFAGHLAGSGFAVGASVEFEDRVAAHHDRRAGECVCYRFGLGAGKDLRDLGRRCIGHGPFDCFFVYVADDHLGLHAGGTQRCESGG